MVRVATSAKFPSTPLSLLDIGLFTNNEDADLVSNATAGDTTFDVDDASAFAVGMWLSGRSQDGFEIVQVTAVDLAQDQITVNRGKDGTAAVAHPQGRNLKSTIPAVALNQMRDELVAHAVFLTPAGGAWTPGSVLFIGATGILAQDNANFFYDDSANELLLGGDVKWRSGTSFYGILEHSNTANRTYGFPDISGSVAILSASAAFSNTDNLGLGLRVNTGVGSEGGTGIALRRANITERVQLAWFNSAGVKQGWLDFHGTNAADSSVHNQFEVKVADTAFATYITRFAVEYGSDYGAVKFFKVSEVHINNPDVSQPVNFILKQKDSGGSTRDLLRIRGDQDDATDNPTISIDPAPFVTTRDIVLRFFRDTNTSGQRKMSFFKGDGSPTETFRFFMDGDFGWKSGTNFFGNFSHNNSVERSWTYQDTDGLVTVQDVAFTEGSIPFAAADLRLNQDNANLFWDNANNRLGVGTNTPLAKFHAYLATAGTSISALVEHADNTNPASHAKFQAAVGGAGGGDAYLHFLVTGVTDWAHGIDNSDSDKLVWSQSASLGTNNRMLLDVAGQLSLPTQGVTGGLVLGGDVQIYRSADDELTLPDKFIVSASAIAARFGASAAADVQVYINANSGQSRDLTFASAVSARWIFRATNTAESGSNAGSDLQILSRTDAGASLATVMAFTRSTGQVAMPVQGSSAGLLMGGNWHVYHAAANLGQLGAGDHFQIPSGDLRFDDATRGVILKDPAGTPHYWRVTVDAAGALVTTDLGTSLPAT